MARTKKAAAAAEAKSETIIAYKGFDENLACTPNGAPTFQYEIGKTYRHDGKVAACNSGFHACEHPLDVFRYYTPANNRFAIVELGGDIDRKNDGDSKIAAAEITIKAELRLPELIQAAVKYVLDRVKWIEGTFASGEREAVRTGATGGAATASGDRGAATASGYGGAATASGEGGAATASGDRGAATASGDRGAATASGDWGAATASGDRGAATASGWWGAATASGWRGAATASGTQGAATASGYGGAATASGDEGAATASGTQGAATASGDWGAATASGWRGAATASGEGGAATASGEGGAATASGWRGAATASGDEGAATASGTQGAATASGYQGKARGKEGCALFLVERSQSGEILHAWAGIVGRNGIKHDTFYRLEGGAPIEVE